MGRIKNLESLELEIERTKIRLEGIEGKFDHNLSELRENYGSMAFNSILGKAKPSGAGSFWSRMAEKLMDHPKVQQTIGDLVDKLTGKTEGQ